MKLFAESHISIAIHFTVVVRVLQASWKYTSAQIEGTKNVCTVWLQCRGSSNNCLRWTHRVRGFQSGWNILLIIRCKRWGHTRLGRLIDIIIVFVCDGELDWYAFIELMCMHTPVISSSREIDGYNRCNSIPVERCIHFEPSCCF